MRDPIKTYDARWEVSEFSDTEVRRLFDASLGYARLLGADTIVLTRDARLGCARVLEIGTEAAVSAGFRVLACFDAVSTPLSYFVAMQASADFPGTMGLSVTASHNPGHYIGIKYTAPGVESIGYDCGPLKGLTKVKELYHSASFISGKKEGGKLQIISNPAEDYIRYTMELANVRQGDLEGLKIVLDTFNGSAGPELYRALTKCGAVVHPLRLVPNGEFPTGSPNPTSAGKMDSAVALAKKINADIVIGIDGDGDRIVFGDQEGIFSAGFVMIPILKTILGNTGTERQKILYDPKVNPLALAKWAETGAEPVLYRNGHSQIKGYMKETGAIGGAEESGHFYHRLPAGNLQVAGENSLYTILLFLQAVMQQKNILLQVREMQNKIFTSGEFNFHFPDNLVRDRALNRVISLFREGKATLATKSASGIDLEGTVIYKGVTASEGAISIDTDWYSAYIRTATNEKGIVRSYVSASNTEIGEKITSKIIAVLKDEFKGVETE